MWPLPRSENSAPSRRRCASELPTIRSTGLPCIDADAERDHAFFAERRSDKVTIGNDVWIGHGVLVLPGVKVDDGAVLAGGAVVTRDVAPYSIVGGVPARPIRDRFPADIAARLVRIAWWDWPFDLIMERLADFQSTDIVAFCDRWDNSVRAE
jgi:hypothetical protein